MRGRIAATVVGAVVAALVLVGLGTLVLTRAAAQRDALRTLEDQADALAELVAVAVTPAQAADPQQPRPLRAALRRVSQALDVQEVGVLVVTADGREVGTLPPGVALDDGELATLGSGGSVSGRDDGTLYAAAGRPIRTSTLVVALSAEGQPFLRGGVGWFLLTSGVVIALSVLVAFRVGSQLARPVRDASEVAGRIAAGDLSARLPEPAPAASDEPAVLARSVNAMAGALERSRVLEQQFLLSISHDLRTPLTNIRGYAEAIADGAVERPADAAEVIVAESGRLDRLVRDLLDLARLEARQFTLHPTDADLAAEVGDAAEAFRNEVTAAGLDLVVAAEAPCRGRADLDRLAQVVGNLVANAVRYARTTVTVSARPDGDVVVLTVSDDGVGISPADLPHVFERLYRSTEQPVRSESGGGLGLAIVHELVHAMGGRVAVTSPPTGGTTFEVRLPLSPVPPTLPGD